MLHLLPALARFSFVFATFGLLSANAAVGIINGSFEDEEFRDAFEAPLTTLRGWELITTTDQGPWGIHNKNEPRYGTTTFGSQYVTLPPGPKGDQTGIVQKVDGLKVGADYELIFRVANYNQTIQSGVLVTIEGDFEDRFFGPKPDRDVFGWKEGNYEEIVWSTHTVRFTASAEARNFIFRSQGDGYAALDGIELSQAGGFTITPEPSRALLLAIGGVPMMLRRRRSARAPRQ
jgi:hypothetical protein